MCGICGKFIFDANAKVDPTTIQQMMSPMIHRGPDGDGCFLSGPVGLGHRRLSIIDLEGGKQPLSNEDGTIWITFNGEIYNYRELRQQSLVRDHIYHTNSDTEVLVHLYEDYGVDFLSRLRGMFAFGLWDKRQRRLILARDRVGIKPLYFFLDSSKILFASEIKSLLAAMRTTPNLEFAGLRKFLLYGYTPGEDTVFKGIRKVLPGEYLVVDIDGSSKKHCYWDFNFGNPSNGRNKRTLIEELHSILSDSIRCHMISDVPVGVLLSGGVDSTAVLSYAVENTDKPVSTFTVGFDDPVIPDERSFANLAAKHFGSEHHEITFSARNFMDFLPEYVWHMEELVCEPPAIALYYVSKLAANHVKVLLSGEGGDEAFAGYPEYRNYLLFEKMKSFLPFGCRNVLFNNSFFRKQNSRLSKYASLASLKFCDFYFNRSAAPTSFYWNEGSDLISDPSLKLSVEDTYFSSDLIKKVSGTTQLSQMLYVDSKTWLPDDLLIKADKMTMATSVELRVPLLDHLFLEYAATLRDNNKVRGWQTKFLLRQAFKDRVPREILTRKKAGFPVPYGRWLRTYLRSNVNDLLLSNNSRNLQYFNKNAVEKLLNQNATIGCYDKEVFKIVVLELWLRKFLPS